MQKNIIQSRNQVRSIAKAYQRTSIKRLDKDDMLQGLISIESLIAFTEVWRDNGMPDYAHGKFETYEEEKSRESKRFDNVEKNNDTVYRRPFVEYRADE